MDSSAGGGGNFRELSGIGSCQPSAISYQLLLLGPEDPGANSRPLRSLPRRAEGSPETCFARKSRANSTAEIYNPLPRCRKRHPQAKFQLKCRPRLGSAGTSNGNLSNGVRTSLFQGQFATNLWIAAAEVMLIDGHKGTKQLWTIACRLSLRPLNRRASL